MIARVLLMGSIFAVAAAFLVFVVIPFVKMAIACGGDCRVSLGG